VLITDYTDYPDYPIPFLFYPLAKVRYVIDYYHDESAVQADKTPQHMLDPSMRSIQVDIYMYILLL
jgi:hypothetical protein